jgi:hypothetical protein
MGKERGGFAQPLGGRLVEWRWPRLSGRIEHLLVSLR